MNVLRLRRVTHSPYTGPRRPELAALTGLRFVAAFAVLAYHFTINNSAGLPSMLKLVLSRGAVGVVLFFVLSGFVLTYRYAGHVTDMRSYALARIARIYPLYVFALVIGLPAFLERAEAGQLSRAPAVVIALTELFVGQAWGPWALDGMNSAGWSLSVEAFFYALFPFLLPMLESLTNRQLFARVGLIWVITMLLQGGLLLARDGMDDPGQRYALDAFAAFHPLMNLTSFLLGMIAALWFVRLPASQLTASKQQVWLATVAEVCCALVVVGVLSLSMVPSHLLRVGLLAPALAIFVVALAGSNGLLARLLSTPLFRLLGQASYALYLLQESLFRLLQATVLQLPMLAQNPLLGRFVALGTILLAAVACYWVIEIPARRLLLHVFTRPVAVA